MPKVIDLRSDTVSLPTPEMKEAMMAASLGDDGRPAPDGRGGDPTVRELEDLAAQMLGKEEALLMPSGTMANTVALLTHCRRGDSVCMDSRAHVYVTEKAGFDERYFGMKPVFVQDHYGAPDPDDAAAKLKNSGARLVWLENTHNAAGGTCLSIDQMKDIYRVAKEAGASVHTDGARIFNAAAALGVDAAEIARHTDTLMFCLSKGLGAPIGSVLLGPRDFIRQARSVRKYLGGTLRQAGIIAAAGIVALQQIAPCLAEDHRKARRLAEGLVEAGLKIDLQSVQSNLVFLDFSSPHTTAEQFVKTLAEVDILALSPNPSQVRLVTHYDVSMNDIDTALQRIRSL